MCLFTKGRNALIAVLDLALHEEHGPVALPAICERTGLSLSYLECIFRKLRHHGIVLTMRGAHGGFMLARPVNDLTVADIILAIRESKEEYEGGGVKTLREADAYADADETAQKLWAALSQHLFDYCDTISLHDLIEKQRISRSKMDESPRSPFS